MIKISIVGGGSAGISVFVNLIERLIKEERKDISIILLEKNEIGIGYSYGTTEVTHVLNLTADRMSPIENDSEHFLTWIRQNKEKCSAIYPEIDVENSRYLPRHLFGLYLKDLAYSTKQKALESKINVEFRFDEVIDIQPAGYRQVQLNLAYLSGGTDDFDVVVLCIGHLPSSEYKELQSHSQYFHSPWPIQEISRSIPKDSDIGIVGTRLRAIDAVLGLVAQGHTGKITLVSRGGLLPAVIGPTEKYTREYLTLDNISALTGSGTQSLSLENDLIPLFWKEIEHAQKATLDESVKQEILHPQITAHEWLEKEIKAVNSKRSWQSVLTSLYSIVPDIWRKLDDSDKKIFLDKYYSLWMTYLASFPLQNAEKLFNLLKTGQLEVKKDLRSIVFDKTQNTFHISLGDGSGCSKVISASYLLNATGTGRDISRTDSVLLQNLLEGGLIRSHPLGGIDVKFKTLSAVNSFPSVNLHVVGDAAWGVCMATADLAQIGKQANRLVNTIMFGIKKKNASSSVRPIRQASSSIGRNSELPKGARSSLKRKQSDSPRIEYQDLHSSKFFKAAQQTQEEISSTLTTISSTKSEALRQ